MPGTWTQPQPPPHKCDVPVRVPYGMREGAIWRCDDCGNAWKVEVWQQYNEQGFYLSRSPDDDQKKG